MLKVPSQQFFRYVGIGVPGVEPVYTEQRIKSALAQGHNTVTLLAASLELATL